MVSALGSADGLSAGTRSLPQKNPNCPVNCQIDGDRRKNATISALYFVLSGLGVWRSIPFLSKRQAYLRALHRSD